ncbi:hypothetical protein [Alkalimonas sp.]|uniref:hypothetical protein n=1 Tax=Alkalimonas sp. TaxID=1872453 RepID=UPI00263BBD9C|nr:hypothetical protein [Alkalimonas sp.]MCC5827229.1 hypothetical protein [Alkalimonas sp.]
MIALIGSRKVAQIAYVFDALVRQGINPVLIDFSEDQLISFCFSSENKASLTINGEIVEQITCAWRCTKILFSNFGTDQVWIDNYLSGSFRKESYLNFISLYENLIFNRPSMDYLSQRKILQLDLARRHGLLIPKTIVSNSIADIRHWTSGRNKFITKCVGNSGIPVLKENKITQEAIPTCRLDINYLNAKTDDSEPFHILIQEEVDKKFEYRCIYINGNFFTFRIDPYQHPIMEVDYRQGGMMVNYQPCDIPDKIKSKLLTYSREINLFSGCFDLIEDKSGNYYFLEVNPEGIWGLHDEILDGQISLELAKQLIQMSNNFSSSD